ncbi:winged helix-turn-helix transcriptional regulator [Arenibacterium halophilum]|uniref:Winged helix-turn-helix transcriptional regulator n=2 Tax=Arenibacterium halophilum TaxID=2583821 RepID=A0ABY2X9U8_9RHOB|nr:winged helix-turn-helix transcriptional regulator [Arenibacterium halophilum]
MRCQQVTFRTPVDMPDQQPSSDARLSTKEWPPADSLAARSLTLELHFLAHLNLIDDGDRRIADLGLGLGRVHHRILYFVTQSPGITVGQLLDLIRVTNQNIHRPMGDLVRMGLIQQRTSEIDRRQRHLHTTPEGEEMLRKITSFQFDRIGRACAAAGPEAMRGFWTVLWNLIEDRERDWLENGKRGDDTLTVTTTDASA